MSPAGTGGRDRSDPDNIRLRLKLANALRDSGRVVEATRAFVAVAKACRDRGMRERAYEACQSALALAPADPEANQVLSELGRAESAAPGGLPPLMGSAPGGTRTQFRRPPPLAAAPPRQQRLAAPRTSEPSRASRPGSRGAMRAKLSGLASAQLPQILANMTTGLSPRECAAGEAIVREGESASELFLVVGGAVRLTRGEPPIEIDVVTTGGVFGEVAVLDGGRRHATATAMEDVQVYAVPDGVLRKAMAGHPEVESLLRKQARDRKIRSAVWTASMLADVSDTVRSAVAAKLDARSFAAGAPIMRAGEVPTHAGLVLAGSVEIRERRGTVSVAVATLGPGDDVCAGTLVRGGRLDHDLVASGAAEVAMLPRDALFELADQAPAVWMRVRTRV